MLPMSADLCSSTCEQQQQQQQQQQLQPREQSCNAADLCKESERICTESETFCILGQFEKLYKNRLAEVEAGGADATSAQITELKLKIMTDWVEDLGEQNKMLIRTVHELEQAAISRVKLLENKLQETSTLISQNMSHSDKSEEDLNALSHRTSKLLHDQNDMQEKIDYLQNDVRNLLKLIKRGREENNWNLDGMKFCSIQPSDIPAPMNCSCCQLDDPAAASLIDVSTQQIDEYERLLALKDNEIRKLKTIINEKCIETVNRTVRRIILINYPYC
ncbi:PREDICTED: uncharacterized protein LOC105359022 [Ceratosolen solmsi marchali]|uniref:Uncharacterized protein LOC105359022 n=1 Tax=Ceratosolen solmsi marchali TaxID=326594 RepID=A0AAJ6YAY9_9HYME|nr:PREDICTED: uncharacterized protein LOC105359022 [Ceratosolen solmsi marchali]